MSDTEDTISLIDLLVVLLRYRVWIAAITVAGLLVSLVYFWVLPKFELVKVTADTSYTTQVTVNIVNPPGLLGAYFDTNTANLTQAWFQNLSLVTQVYREFMVKNNDLYQPDQFYTLGSLETYLQESVLGKSLKVAFDSATVAVKVTLDDVDATRAKKFLAALSAKVKAQVTAVLQKRIENARQALEDSAASLNASTTGTQERILALSDLRQKQFLLSQLVQDKNFPFQQQGDLVVLQQVSGKSTNNKGLSPSLMVVVLSLGSFFAAIFLAFVFEYLRRVRTNADDMRKIHEVLDKKAQTR